MKTPILLPVFFAASLLAVTSASAQMPGGSQAGLNAAMLKLFAGVSNFTSKADVHFQEKGAGEPMTMAVDFLMLDGKARMDLDLGTLKSKQLPAESLASFKAAGLDKLATVVLPERKMILLIYPLVRGYVEIPMSKEEAAEMGRKFKVEKTRLSRETIGGHDCEKNKVIVTSESGGKQEAVVWYAADLKNFPLKVQMDQQQTTVVMQYRDVKLVRPEARQFEAPAGFAKHASVEQLMQNALMKLLDGAKPPK